MLPLMSSSSFVRLGSNEGDQSILGVCFLVVEIDK
jgi:hypothetical protein